MYSFSLVDLIHEANTDGKELTAVYLLLKKLEIILW